jgi:hypothetical protein
MTTSLRISGLGMALVACSSLWLGCGGGGHDGVFQEVGAEDCGACHLRDYQSTNQPSHVALLDQGYDFSLESCPKCHGNQQWRPPENPGLHPDADFLISSGPHHPDLVACADCHDPTLDETSSEGLNTNCVGCHTGAHILPIMDDVHKNDPEYPIGDPRVNFCLDCHDDGRCDPCEP